MCVLRTSMCCTGLSLSLGPKGRFFERLPHQDASLKKSKLSQIKPSPSHHSSGITFSKQKHRFAEKTPSLLTSLEI